MEADQESVHTCAVCGILLYNCYAHIPGKGDACLKCYIESAKKEETRRAHKKKIN